MSRRPVPRNDMKFFRFLALLSLAGCSLSTDPISPDGSTKVLFIGSSLIDAHDMDDHLPNGDALRALQSEEDIWRSPVGVQFPAIVTGRQKSCPTGQVQLLQQAADDANAAEVARRGARLNSTRMTRLTTQASQ